MKSTVIRWVSGAVLLVLLSLPGSAEEPGDFASGVSTAPAEVGKASAAAEKRGPAAGGTTYTVWLWQETGDCLWNLAKRFYGDPWLWKKIYLANRHQIENPAVIYPRQVLIIPPLDEHEK